MNAARWNELYPVGTAVDYEPIKGDGVYDRTRTRSEAWTLGSGHAVALIEGRSGGVHLDHLNVILGFPCCSVYGAGNGEHGEDCESGQTDDVEPL